MSMRLLDRYLLGAFARIFTFTALSAPLLFILADATEHLGSLLADGRTPQAIALSYLGQVPTYLVWAFPLAGLIATLFTLQPLVRRGEVAAALAGGIPLHRLFRPIFVGALGAAVLGVAILEASPRLAHGSRWLQAGAESAPFAYLTDSGDVLSVQRRDARDDRSLLGVVIRTGASDARAPIRLIVARAAQWSERGGWTLRDGQQWTITADDRERITRFDELGYPALRETPRQLLAAHGEDARVLTFAELERAIGAAERSGARSGFLRTALWQRITIPLTTLIIVLFAAPLATIARPGGAQPGIGLALVVAIAYLAIVRFSEAMGTAELVPASAAAAAPAVLFAAGAAFLLRRVRT